ncbi:glutathione peroxidase [Siminovitchia sediminis]|uniref:Glutathione peroxidase n=1 Tax=Siminovitchia sediminis TaxID=1274353 RepID=A0ABW4KQA7_9BACI
MTIYNYTAQLPDGNEILFSRYKGKILLIVNSASKCGFTPQLKELQQLYDTYKDQGLVVLGFPSDQFLNQEYDDINDTLEFCRTRYGVSFPIFAKTQVKGDEAHPLFTFLTTSQRGLLTENIKWNFTKFLIDRQGRVVKRYAPHIHPAKIIPDIEKLL